MIDCSLNEGLNHRLTPWVQHLPVKTSAESANAGEACAENFDRFSVQNVHPGFCQDALNFPNFSRLKVVITYDGDAWNSHVGFNVLGKVAASSGSP